MWSKNFSAIWHLNHYHSRRRLRVILLTIILGTLLSSCAAENRSPKSLADIPTAAIVESLPAQTSKAGTPTPTAASVPSPTIEPASTARQTPEPTVTPTPEPTEMPAPEIGKMSVNPETEMQEVWVGDSYLEAPANFRAEYLSQGEDGVVRYRAPGLMLNYDVEASDWRIPPLGEIAFNSGQTTEIWVAGGEARVNQEAFAIFRRKFTHEWINTLANDGWREHMFGSSNIVSWEQIETYLVENNYKLPLLEEDPEIPYFNYGFNFTNLLQYLRKYDIKEIDMSGEGVVVVDWEDLENNTHGVESFVDEELDGQNNLFQSGEIAWGMKLTPDGDIVWISGSRNKAIIDARDEIVMGGEEGGYESDRDLKMAAAQLLSVLETMREWHPDDKHQALSYPLIDDVQDKYHGVNYVPASSDHLRMIEDNEYEGMSLFVDVE